MQLLCMCSRDYSLKVKVSPYFTLTLTWLVW